MKKKTKIHLCIFILLFQSNYQILWLFNFQSILSNVNVITVVVNLSGVLSVTDEGAMPRPLQQLYVYPPPPAVLLAHRLSTNKLSGMKKKISAFF